MTTRILIAQRLVDGIVVFAGAEGWIEHIDEAAVAHDDDAAAALSARGEAGIAANEIVDPALIEVTREDGRIVPAHIRERIRAAGPTVYPAHGKQAEAR